MTLKQFIGVAIFLQLRYNKSIKKGGKNGITNPIWQTRKWKK